MPKPHEVKGLGNFMPNIAENADELIDYALSFIPKSIFGPFNLNYTVIFIYQRLDIEAVEEKKECN